jgi:hypothetical protein
MNKFGVVIPCAENRLENLILCLGHIYKGTRKPTKTVVVCDGFDSIKAKAAAEKHLLYINEVVDFVTCEKHIAGSGTLQPKNFGAAHLEKNYKDINYYWFIDSDIIVEHTTLLNYNAALNYLDEPRILIGPYEWLPKGNRGISPHIKNDPRWDMFSQYGPSYASVGEIHFALANFGGNIIYPKDAFTKVGGFWDDLSAGRVEDGEMGLRCASMGIPMSVVSSARAYHLWHPVNHQWKIDTNAKEVPMINERHPWVENEGMIVVEKDGKRFDWVDPNTGEQVNTLDIWKRKTLETSN